MLTQNKVSEKTGDHFPELRCTIILLIYIYIKAVITGWYIVNMGPSKSFKLHKNSTYPCSMNLDSLYVYYDYSNFDGSRIHTDRGTLQQLSVPAVIWCRDSLLLCHSLFDCNTQHRKVRDNIYFFLIARKYHNILLIFMIAIFQCAMNTKSSYL